MLLRCCPRQFPRISWTSAYVFWRRNLTAGSNTVPKPYYITTPIFYPNAVPHIGHLYSLVIGDIFARFRRLIEPERHVRFLAGTDEHGLKIQKAAQALGLPPDLFCDQISVQFRRLADKAQVTHTHFIRTTERAHHEAVADVWRKLEAKGLIYKGDYSGWYSITDECFYTDAQITKSISAQDEPITVSTETGALVEWQNEQNYMFRLSAFRSSLLAHYTSPQNSGVIYPPQHQSHVVQILSEPLEDLSISRPRSRLSWGVPVPSDPEHTIYVWFDALLVYLSGMKYPWDGNGKPNGWPVDIQIIGKDILRFHAIYLPAILQALELPLQGCLLSHAHWTVEQKKMSKSLGNVADPFDAIGYFGADVVRYYLARVGGRFRDDVDWSQAQLDKHSKEIQSLLGNFFLRITSPTIQARMACASKTTLEEIYQNENSPNRPLIQAHRRLPGQVKDCLERLEVADALGYIVELLRLANKTITDIAPWKQTSSPSEAYASYLTSIETLRVAGICLQPFVPSVAGTLLSALGIREDARSWAFASATREAIGKVTSVKLF